MSITLYRGGNLVRTWRDRDYRLRRAPVAQIQGADLFEQDFQMGKRVRVGDLFLMMAKDLDFWERLLGPWTRAVVAEGVAFQPQPTPAIQGVRLEWRAALDDNDGLLRIAPLMEVAWFHLENGGTEPFGKTSPYKVGLISAEYFGHEFLHVNPRFSVFKADKAGRLRKLLDGHQAPTLFDVVHAMFAEFTLLGSPAERDEIKEQAAMWREAYMSTLGLRVASVDDDDEAQSITWTCSSTK